MNIDAKIGSLKSEQFFNVDSENVFVIPKYQRSYTWSKNQWQALFDDITGNPEKYFLGSMLCVKIENYEHADKGFVGLEVVDGQQRLTTLGLFFMAIHSVLKEYAYEDDKIKQHLLVTSKKNKNILFSRIFPQTNDDNRMHYLNLLQEEFGITLNKAKNSKNDKLIREAFEFFKNCLKEYVEKSADNDSKCEGILNIYNKLRETSMVRIVANNHSDAYVLFEALNNRGVPLSLRDLIKNQILAKLSEQFKNEPNSDKLLENYLGYWDNEIIGKIPRDTKDEINRQEQERFFRQIYNGCRISLIEKYKDLKPLTDKLIPAERSNLLKLYETIINNKDVDVKDFVDTLRIVAKFYSQIHAKDESIFSNEDVVQKFEDLRNIKGGTSGTLLLYLLINKEKLQLKDENFVTVLETLVIFFVRRSFTGKPRSNDLDDIFIKFIDTIETNNYVGDDIEKILLKELKNKSSDTDDFEKELRGNVYDGKSSRDYKVLFILSRLANKHRGYKHKINFWAKGKGNKRFEWTIEHIMPQTLKSKKDRPNVDNNYWINLIGNGDENVAKEIQEQCVHKLGNLTLTKYNSDMSNLPFPDKKDLKDKDRNAIGLVILSENDGLNSYVYSQTKWTQQQIDTRTKILVEEILEIFAW